MPDNETKTEQVPHAMLRYSGAFRRYGEAGVCCPLPTHAIRSLKIKPGQQAQIVFAEDGKSFTVSWK